MGQRPLDSTTGCAEMRASSDGQACSRTWKRRLQRAPPAKALSPSFPVASYKIQMLLGRVMTLEDLIMFPI